MKNPYLCNLEAQEYINMKTETRMDNIAERTARFIERERLLLPKDTVVIALSGGSDSVCLLRVLLRLNYKVVAAHCNFHLRGEESNRDECFVRELCQRLGVELDVREFDTMDFAESNHISIEMAARQQRYDFFEEVRQRVGAQAIAVAHHQDDCIETFFLNAVRGTGVRGLGGIKVRNGHVVRPLLCLTHAEVLAELHRIGQDYVDDSTNGEDIYIRNKVRLDIMPILRKINSAASRNLMTTIENLQEVAKVYETSIQQDIKRCVSAENSTLTIDTTQLKLCVSPISVLHEVLSRFGFNRSQEQNILTAEGSGKIFHSVEPDSEGKHYVALTDRNRIVVYPSDDRVFDPVALSDFSDIKVVEVKRSEVQINSAPRFAYIDADKVKNGLIVRRVANGDRIRPFGMKGTKLISDLLTDAKMNVMEKQKQFVVCDGQTVVWVVGVRSSEDYRIDAKTERVLVLSVDDE